MPRTRAVSPDKFATFGDLLKHLRRRAGLTQRELSIAVGYSDTQLSRMEQNERVPDQATLTARFVPALHLQHEQDILARLLQLAEAARQEPTRSRDTQSTAALPKHNLPQSLSNFIGREREIVEVKQLLQSGRLVTFTGAGGSGKTRLALQVGSEVATAYSDGIWLVDLAPLSNADLVPHKVAAVVGAPEEPGQPVTTTLTEYCRSRELLLILDNCEHLVEACAQFVETLLSACPGLAVLATSREALIVAGETLYPVPALAFPDASEPWEAGPDEPALEALSHYDAVRLFVERATAVAPTFRLTIENAVAVAQVCQRLDGIPLALELAAARVKVLSVAQIATRLGAHEQFDLLTSGRRTAPPRHQTLRAMIDWSHDLLPENERFVLRRLAVFAGGFTLTAATAVCADVSIQDSEVLGLLAHLVDKSLVLTDTALPSAEPRYRLLETIRQYALDRLQEAHETDAVQRRHAQFFLGLAEEAEPRLTTSNREPWMERLEAEHDNLRAVLVWSRAEASTAEIMQRLAAMLGWFWTHSYSRREGRGWLAEALERVDNRTPVVVRAKLLTAAGSLAQFDRAPSAAWSLLDEGVRLWRTLGPAGQANLAYALAIQAEAARNLGDPRRGTVLGEEAVALFRAQADRWGLAFALGMLALSVRDQEDFARARGIIEESVAIWRDEEDGWGLWLGLLLAGMVGLRQGDFATAQARYDEALAVARARGDRSGIAGALGELGSVMLNLDDMTRAQRLFEESLRRSRELGLRYGIAYSQLYLGILAVYDGKETLAEANFRQALGLAGEVGRAWFPGDCLKGMAGLAAIRGQALRSARLWGAAEGILAKAESYMDNADRIYFGRIITAARDQLGEAAFESARAEGHAMTTEQAIAYALAGEAE